MGRGPDGLLRYFLLPGTRVGTMAERTVIDTRRSIVLPDTTDPVAVAAAMNPAMSSWVALRQRVSFQAGQDVLVLGATGSAGQLAVQIARLFGAGQVIAAGRDAGRLAGLAALGATATVPLAKRRRPPREDRGRGRRRDRLPVGRAHRGRDDRRPHRPGRPR